MTWLLLAFIACKPVEDTDTFAPDTDADWMPGDPVAVCAVIDDHVQPRDGVARISGDDSYDPAQQGLTDYAWRLLSAPVGSEAELDVVEAGVEIEPDIAGPYLVELIVTATDGRVSAPCEVAAHATPAESLWIELTWERAQDNLDLHVLRGNGGLNTDDDCYPQNCRASGGQSSLDWGDGGEADDPVLLRDDTRGTGPEIIRIQAPADGVYRVAVVDVPALVNTEPNLATIAIYIDGELAMSGSRTVTGESEVPVYFAAISFPNRQVRACAPDGC